MDPNFENIKDKVMLEGQRAKYNQDENSKMVLLATKKATCSQDLRGWKL